MFVRSVCSPSVSSHCDASASSLHHRASASSAPLYPLLPGRRRASASSFTRPRRASEWPPSFRASASCAPPRPLLSGTSRRDRVLHFIHRASAFSHPRLLRASASSPPSPRVRAWRTAMKLLSEELRLCDDHHELHPLVHRRQPRPALQQPHELPARALVQHVSLLTEQRLNQERLGVSAEGQREAPGSSSRTPVRPVAAGLWGSTWISLRSSTAQSPFWSLSTLVSVLAP